MKTTIIEQRIMTELYKRQIELEPMELTRDVAFECRLVDCMINEIKCICDDEQSSYDTGDMILRN